MRANEFLKESPTTFYHGTSSTALDRIKIHGFTPPSYFTTSYEDAEYYAATGGEEDLQRREEEYEERTGVNPRDEYDPWDMYKMLYPKGAHPVVISVNLSPAILLNSRTDSGATGAIVVDVVVSPEYITNITEVNFEN